MIDRGILEWLTGYLGDHLDAQSAPSSVTTASSTTYGLEYSTALFMNLCLHRSGKERCLPRARAVLDTFSRLLTLARGGGDGEAALMPYVSGVLYSLLSHPGFAAEARRMGMEKRLQEEKKRQWLFFFTCGQTATSCSCCCC